VVVVVVQVFSDCQNIISIVLNPAIVSHDLSSVPSLPSPSVAPPSAMNLFRLLGKLPVLVVLDVLDVLTTHSSPTGDLSHLASIFILVHKIHTSRSCRGQPPHLSWCVRLGLSNRALRSGISFKTQLLYVVVFVTRYLDMFWTYVSLYNSAMKLFFIASSCYILFLMRYRFRSV
jgi:hypothetical protein